MDSHCAVTRLDLCVHAVRSHQWILSIKFLRQWKRPFFWFTLPDIFPENSAMVELARDLHFWTSYAFLGFMVLQTFDQRKVVRSLWRRSSGAIKKAMTQKG